MRRLTKDPPQSHARPNVPGVDESRRNELADHLASSNMRLLLQLSGLYLVAYELVRNGVIEGVRGFFCNGFDQDGLIYSVEYTQIRSSRKHELDACLWWLVDKDVLTQDQADSVTTLRNERNRVAHELPRLFVDPSFRLDENALLDARDVLKRLAVFFGGINADTNPDFDSIEVDYEEIESTASLLYAELLIAFSEAEAVANEQDGPPDSY